MSKDYYAVKINNYQNKKLLYLQVFKYILKITLTVGK